MRSRGPKAFALSALLALSMATSPALAVTAEMPMGEAELPSATSTTTNAMREETQKSTDAKAAPTQVEPELSTNENLTVEEPLVAQGQADATLEAQTDAIDINSATFTDISPKSYTGSPIEPKPTIKVGDKTLVEGTDYTLAYSNNVEATTQAVVTITGIGAYSGSKTMYFEIFGEGCGVSYQTHVQNVGWQGYKRDGALSGTEGESLRLEGIQIQLEDKPKGMSGGIEYQTHVQNTGWEKNWAANNAVSGTQGKSLRLECIRIRLTGDIAKNYHVWYRVHVQNVGWMDWAKDGADSGTSGKGLRLEAIEIRVLPWNAPAPGDTTEPLKFAISYRTHVQYQGWQAYKTDGETSGTEGKSLRLEGIEIKAENAPYQGKVQYLTHVQNKGWEEDWVQDGATSGTTGQSLRLEAIRIRLTDDLGDKYDVYYCVHAQNVGWMGWAKNGEPAGTEGFGQRLEAIKIVLVPKGDAAPGSTEDAYRKM